MPAIDEQLLISEITSLLHAKYVPMADEIASLVGNYSQLCNEANSRLRECQKLLRQGLRGEAIQLCEQEPNLLDLVTTLDFPERAKWYAYVKQCGEKAPELVVDVARELSEAYASNLSLDGLLRKHRKLALGRAPLPQRIETLQQIAVADPTNPIWNEDLRKYQQVRLQAIQQAAATLAREGNVDAIAELEEELTTSSWLEAPPKALVEKVRQAHTRLRSESARAEMTQLGIQLTAAHSEFDAERARELRGRWQVCLMLSGLADDDPLVDSVAPTLAWLANQDAEAERQSKFTTAVARLEQALDGEPSRSDLERLTHECLRLELPLPSLIEQRLRNRISSIDLATTRRRRLVLAAIFGAMILVGVATAWGIHAVMQTNVVASHVAALEAMMEDSNLAGANEYLQKLRENSPTLADAPEIDVVATKLASLEEQQGARHDDFEHSLAETRSLANLEHPSLSALSKAERQLRDTTMPLATSEADRQQAAELRKEIESAKRKEQRSVDDAFSAKVEALTQRLVALEKAHKEKTASKDQILEITRDIQQLAKNPGLVTAQLLRTLEPLRARADALLNVVGSRGDQSKLLTRITDSIGNPNDFAAALAVYANDFGQTARGIHFRQAADEKALWERVHALSDLTSKWNRAKVLELNGDDAKQLLDESQAFLDQPGADTLAATPRIREKIDYLKAATSRRADKERLVAPLREVLNNPTIASLSMVRLDEGGRVKQYYLREAPNLDATTGKVVMHYLVDFELNTKTRSFKPEELAQSKPPYDDPAPQSEVARDLIDMLDHQLDSLGWEVTFVLMIERVDSEANLDLIPKLFLLDKLMEVGGSASPMLRKLFETSRGLIAAGNVSLSVNWLNPDDAEAVAERGKAQELLKGLPEIQKFRGTLGDELATLDAPVGPTYDWVAWLKQEGSSTDKDRWTCVTRSPVSEQSGDLIVVYSQANEPVKFAKIGTMESGKATVTSSDAEALIEGRPVYCVLEVAQE